jgi:serine-type D-Ala-D-Ala carboxypeptidase (penicillin-binding protein 5/6)
LAQVTVRPADIFIMNSEVRLKSFPSAPVICFSLLIVVTNAAAVPGKTLPAKAAVVMDSTGTVLFSKYPNARLAPASTVKLVTAMVAIDNLKADDVVKISKYASKVRTIPPGICPEEELAVIDLLHLALMKSINSAAVALAEASAGTEDDFVVLMNQKAQEIGAHDTLFANASGLPKGTQYSTANDLALIMKAALSYPLIRDILATKAYIVRTAAGREIFLENSNHLLWEDQTMIIGKTGYTGNARHCFVGAVDTGNGMAITAVLGARSRHNLWRATSMLAEIGVHPELAHLLEAPRANRGNGRANIRKSKAITAGVGKELAVQDFEKTWMLRGFSQQLKNN